jgi:hypothetical protein
MRLVILTFTIASFALLGQTEAQHIRQGNIIRSTVAAGVDYLGNAPESGPFAEGSLKLDTDWGFAGAFVKPGQSTFAFKSPNNNDSLFYTVAVSDRNANFSVEILINNKVVTSGIAVENGRGFARRGIPNPNGKGIGIRVKNNARGGAPFYAFILATRGGRSGVGFYAAQVNDAVSQCFNAVKAKTQPGDILNAVDVGPWQMVGGMTTGAQNYGRYSLPIASWVVGGSDSQSTNFTIEVLNASRKQAIQTAKSGGKSAAIVDLEQPVKDTFIQFSNGGRPSVIAYWALRREF